MGGSRWWPPAGQKPGRKDSVPLLVLRGCFSAEREDEDQGGTPPPPPKLVQLKAGAQLF